MNNEEIEALIEQLKAQGLSDEDIMNIFYRTFEKGDMDRKDLETLANAMGYELTDEFKNEPTPDPIEAKGMEGMSTEDLEAAKEIAPNESAEEFKEKIEGEEDKSGEEETESEEETETEGAEEGEEDGEEEKSEEEEWEEANKYFKLND